MRIALINSNPSWGGGERWFAEAACALLERGHEVLAVAREGSRLLERLTAVAHDAAPWEGAWARLVAPPTDVVLCNAPRDLRAVARVLPRARAPVLVLRRGIDRPLRGGFWRRRLWRRVAMVIVNSEASGRQVRRSLPWYPADRVVRIYNPVTLDPLPREPQGDRPPRLGAVGRLTRQKGFDVLIDAVAQLDEPPGLELWIAGEGRARAALERRIARRGLDTRCRLLGHLEDVRPLYASVDLLAIPSRYEGFCFTAVEAALAVLPIVASDTSSLPEVVHAPEAALLVPPEDPAALRDAVRKLLALSPAERQRMGEAGAAFARARFAPRPLHDRLEAALHEALARGPLS